MALPAPFNPDAIDLPASPRAPTVTNDAPGILATELAAPMPTLDLGDTRPLLGEPQATTRQAPADSFDPGAGFTNVLAARPASHFTIVASFDTSVTNSSVATGYTQAVNAAISYFEGEITNPITVDITFSWGTIDGQPISGPLGESNSIYSPFTYGQVYSAVKGLANQSAVQQAAYATLPPSAPAGVTNLDVNTAQAAALGLAGNTVNGGAIGLGSNYPFFWSQSAVEAGAYDAVSTLEHEISEILGRSDEGGAGGSYTLLDFFRYTALDGGSADPPGSAAGWRDEPFEPGYSTNSYSYFSYNGTTVTLPYDTPTDVGNGADIADWAPSVPTDSFGYGSQGAVAPVSATDLQEMNVLGYSLAAACYAEGTRILTANGPVAVEHLEVGMAVATLSGRLARITWTGRRAVEPARHREPQTLNPIRVRAGAFGHAPHADLVLSPDHAVLLEGRLVPIRHLANGASIAQETRARITYWHLELDRHDAIFAEGMPCETYLDTGNRDAFEGNATTQLHPDFRQHHAERVWAERGCAPILTDPAEPALRRLHTHTLARVA